MYQQPNKRQDCNSIMTDALYVLEIKHIRELVINFVYNSFNFLFVCEISLYILLSYKQFLSDYIFKMLRLCLQWKHIHIHEVDNSNGRVKTSIMRSSKTRGGIENQENR